MRIETKETWKQLGRGAMSFLIALAVVLILARVIHGRIANQVGVVIIAVVAWAAYFAGSRWIERRRPPELKPQGGIAEFSGGLGIGIGLFSAVIAVLWVSGVYHPTGWGTFAGLGTGALAALGAAMLEEVIFRAYLFRLLSVATATWIAVLVTSALFGAVHAANPGANLFSSLAIALEAGVILAGAYAVTGRLWMPIGLHAGWNFAEGALFGMSVSGGPESAALSHGTLRGPTILTGGAFGPEASIVAVLCLAVGVILLWHTVRLGQVEHPMWNRGTATATTVVTGIC